MNKEKLKKVLEKSEKVYTIEIDNSYKLISNCFFIKFINTFINN